VATTLLNTIVLAATETLFMKCLPHHQQCDTTDNALPQKNVTFCTLIVTFCTHQQKAKCTGDCLALSRSYVFFLTNRGIFQNKHMPD
jgi:hypothetical protein